MSAQERPTIDSLHDYLKLGTDMALCPEVAEAVGTLCTLTRMAGGKQGLFALLTLMTARAGIVYAGPGCEAQAELTQLALTKAVYASFAASHRTLH